MTVISISVAGARDTEEELRSLDDWLGDALRGRVKLELGPPEPGQMGMVPQALIVAVEDAGTRARLVESLEIWLRQRGPEVKIMVRVGDRVAEIMGSGEVDVGALLREALRAAGEG